MSRIGLLVLGAAALGCCSGALAQEPPAAPAAPPAAQAGKPAHALPKRDTSLVGIDTTGGKVDYKRELFHYGGGTHDPFRTPITAGGGVGPTVNDLRLVSVTYDARYGRSVAIVRETKGDRMHRLRRGDTVGRLRVLQIRQYEVVFQIEEFGFERQVVLSLQRSAEANP